MNINGYYNLPCIISHDLLQINKILAVLLVAILISSVLVINITHKTRLMISKHEQLISETNALDIEWRNLILEENYLGDQNRIERIAIDKLHMKNISPFEEHVILKRNIKN
ncbi:cell division protein FtsL [Candidatus Pantoea carbekii]|uniref:Cell division protein FtsL n=1 Tax=Candidatus Pantoea carbekii TaxID=1235990 RepID=U3U9F6_9GAMM|nr:cell division protein FtsL [Candidatus Pantoea carbekii]AKC31936.1 cell division protein [Candidatus Pantoea carbekii]BAO00453.1 hypothetical protein HHS_04830 [Candidatus Pantoea carbekii]